MHHAAPSAEVLTERSEHDDSHSFSNMVDGVLTEARATISLEERFDISAVHRTPPLLVQGVLTACSRSHMDDRTELNHDEESSEVELIMRQVPKPTPEPSSALSLLSPLSLTCVL